MSGWTVEQSTKILFWTEDFKAVSMVEVMAASLPTQVKIMSALETASGIVVAMVHFPVPRLVLRSSARLGGAVEDYQGFV